MADKPKKDRRPGQKLPDGPDSSGRSAKLERRRKTDWEKAIETTADQIARLNQKRRDEALAAVQPQSKLTPEERDDTLARLERLQTEQPIVELDDPVEIGADALKAAFPTLREDFTDDWFRKVASIVLEATK